MKNKKKFDFGGYVTKAGIKCTDGRIIQRDAFKHNHGEIVPLVWQHMHDDPSNVLGHVLLENREDGVYGYVSTNNTPQGKNAKMLVEHEDIRALSIYANKLVERTPNVIHGQIREVSLVLSGANPGAVIDNISIQHGDGSITEVDDEAIIHFDSNSEFDFPEDEDDEDDEKELDLVALAALRHAAGDDDESVADVFNTLSDKQKDAVYVMIGAMLEAEEGDDLEQSDLNSNDEGERGKMKKNVFDGSDNEDNRPTLTHAQFSEILTKAKKGGSLKEAVLEHAGTYGIDNIDFLFPDARFVGEPTWISRQMEWVTKVLNGTTHSPFSRIKSMHADITADEARAKGYVTGALKLEEVFPILKRTTTPTTIYKKQRLDRDDIVDITDFNVVSWLKAEMRVMLDEEIARAVLVGDGRGVAAEDHINEDNIRPIWGDDPVYVTLRQVASTVTEDELVDEIISSRVDYRGSGAPTIFVAPGLLTSWLLLRDLEGRRLYRSLAELAAELRVSEIVEVTLFEGLTRDVGAGVMYDLKAIVVNLRDYTIGADKGGEVNMFDDFDIDYNQQKYLIETRISGAMTVPKGAIVFEQAVV